MRLEPSRRARYGSIMGLSARTMTREIGTALAVLAIYVLTLLLPLHQAAAQQRDLAALGYSTFSTWSVCTQLAEDSKGDPQQSAALTCPAIGIAKHQFAALVPPVLDLTPPATATPVHYPGINGRPAPTPPDHVGQARAPPVQA